MVSEFTKYSNKTLKVLASPAAWQVSVSPAGIARGPSSTTPVCDDLSFPEQSPELLFGLDHLVVEVFVVLRFSPLQKAGMKGRELKSFL